MNLMRLSHDLMQTLLILTLTIQQLQQQVDQSMYNAFIIRKKEIELEDIKKKSETNRKYVKRYYDVTRPALIDNHSKRINSFIRRMEQQPIQMHLDPYLKNEPNLLDQSKDKRSFSQNTGRRGHGSSIQLYEAQSPHQQTFKFKDIEDWRSFYTPLERIERQRNFELFKDKYGDPTIAYRSIGSQSEYKPGHQFRDRDKNLEINPPMRYTNKPTQQVLAKLKSRYKKSKDKQVMHDTKHGQMGQQKQDDLLVRRNTSSSISGMNEDHLLGDNTTDRVSRAGTDKQTEAGNNEGKKEQSKSKKNTSKLHFKQIMDLEQNISDPKTRKALREILYKCGVYRRKNRRVATDSQVDQLSEFTDARQY